MTLRGLRLIWLIACGAVAAPAPAQQALPPPPQEPILRIDPGMHTAQIRRIGSDAACTLLATGSHDKTVQLWQLPEGKLLRTLRPPIGPGVDGKVQSVAVAPDGSWVAVGGWDAAWSAGRSMHVYIFQASTGALITRLSPQKNVISHLAVSPDGRYLAAHVGLQGLRVWEKIGAGLATWRLVVDDRHYRNEDAYGAAFDHAGALYTVAYDGKLRRYAPGFRGRPIWVTTRGGRQPHSVAVHPAGDRVAVGYYDTTTVEVYDAATLTWRFAADTTSASTGNLASVAWSADGARLYAGGRFTHLVGDLQRLDRYHPILVWDRAGEGGARKLRGPQSTIMHLLSCGDSIAMGASDPSFGLLSRDGSRLAWQEGVQADLRILHGRDQGLIVASNGRRVRFGLEFLGKSPVLFDLVAEQLTDAPDPPGDLVGPNTTNLPVADWEGKPNPRLGGTPIKLEPGEPSRSLAITPDRQRFVLGTETSLRSYDRTGKQLWRKAAPGAAWSVNIARDGGLVLAAYGDGTIRWHRLSDGQELLALFVHKLDRRWVAWTPKGYYTASPGAESLIGWHVNRGWDQAAQFFPADRFREQFNRPDIVKLVLETLDEGKAIEEGNKRASVKRADEDVRKHAPPIVVIQNPGDNSTFRSSEVTIEYNIDSATSQKVTKVDYLINNSALGARFVPETTTGKITSHRATLPLPPEDVTITLVAYEGVRASEPASIRLRWDGAKPGQEHLKRLRALFVGVNEYTSPKLNRLRFSIKDATDLAAIFNLQEGKSYSKVEARLLRDATRVDIIKGLAWLEKGSEEGDVSLLFLAGHGTTDEQQHFYFMAVDSDPDELRATAVTKDDILRTIRNLKGARVVMLDACRSGATDMAALAAPSPVDMNRAPNEIGDKSLGVLLYASAQGRQYSLEHAEWGNGAFTKAMIEGLGGAADSGKRGYVDTEELSLYVRRRVMELTKGKGIQEPVRVKPDAAPEMKLVLLK
jgi:WD40 repeat protein